MKNLRTLSFTAVGVCLVVCIVYGFWLYLVYFKCEQCKYVVGTRNETGQLLREVDVTLYPEGCNSCGILSNGQEAWYGNPPWPVPERAVATFEEEDGSCHELSMMTGLPKDFRGKLLFRISKTNQLFTLSLETKKNSD